MLKWFSFSLLAEAKGMQHVDGLYFHWLNCLCRLCWDCEKGLAALATLPLADRRCGGWEISLECVVSVLVLVSCASRPSPRKLNPVAWHFVEIKSIYFYQEKVKRLFWNFLPEGWVRRVGYLVLSCFQQLWRKGACFWGPDMDSVRFGEQPGVALSLTQEDFQVGPGDSNRVSLWAWGRGFPQPDNRQLL